MTGGRFPAGFVWGAATSAYQIEGGARADGKGESVWDRFCATPGKVRDGATGDIACDHYSHWRDDVDVMTGLGLGAYRFSIAWTRVLPQGVGSVNEPGLDFYDRLVDALLERGIEPWPTLYHWDLPQVLEDQGGWPNRATATAFGEYADAVSRRLGDRVRHWMTVNEPWEIGFLGYHQGIHAPGRRSLRDALAAIHTVLLGHGDATAFIRANDPNASVGLAIDLVACYPDRESPDDAAAALAMDGYFNRWFLDPLAGRGYPADMLEAYGADAPRVEDGDLQRMAVPLDFVGLNYYYSNWVRAGAGPSPIEQLLHATIRPPRTPAVTGLGWAVHPEGFAASLRRLGEEFPGRPLIVTESGAAYGDQLDNGSIDDPERLHYHAAYIDAMGDAISAGTPVAGYFAWSLFDNFEWSEGYGPRFGIVGIDYATQQRIIKLSGRWYRDLIRAHGTGHAG